jgi:hypothetical protein
MSWTFNSRTLFVCCLGGQILELATPSTEHDTSKTFELVGLPTTEHFLRRKEKPKEEKKPEPTTPQPERLEKDLQRQDSVISSSSAYGDPQPEKQDKEKKEKEKPEEVAHEEPAKPQKPAYPLSILSAVASTTFFFVSMSGKDSGCIFKVTQTAEFADEIPAHVGAACTKLRHSKTKRLFLSGGDDGSVEVRRADSLPSKQWKVLLLCSILQSLIALQANIHDGSATITSLITSFDDSYLLSVGTDGNFFVCQIRNANALDEDGMPTSALYLTYFTQSPSLP